MENKEKFTFEQAKERFNKLVEMAFENIDDNDPLGYVLQCGDIDKINEALDKAQAYDNLMSSGGELDFDDYKKTKIYKSLQWLDRVLELAKLENDDLPESMSSEQLSIDLDEYNKHLNIIGEEYCKLNHEEKYAREELYLGEVGVNLALQKELDELREFKSNVTKLFNKFPENEFGTRQARGLRIMLELKQLCKGVKE